MRRYHSKLQIEHFSNVAFENSTRTELLILFQKPVVDVILDSKIYARVPFGVIVNPLHPEIVSKQRPYNPLLGISQYQASLISEEVVLEAYSLIENLLFCHMEEPREGFTLGLKLCAHLHDRPEVSLPQDVEHEWKAA